MANWQATNGAAPRNHEAIAGDRKRYVKYSPAADVVLNPPMPPCIFEERAKGKANARQRKDLQPALIFSFTDPALEPYFKKGDLITCSASLTSVTGGIIMLNLEIAIASKQAPQLFGALRQGDYITIAGLDGSKIRLVSKKSDAGRWEPRLQAQLYRTQYQLGAKDIKLLEEMELDTINIRWSKVQEEYQIFDVEILSRQLRCLLAG